MRVLAELVEPLVDVLPALGASPQPVGRDQLDVAALPGIVHLRGPELGGDQVSRVAMDSEKYCKNNIFTFFKILGSLNLFVSMFKQKRLLVIYSTMVIT